VALGDLRTSRLEVLEVSIEVAFEDDRRCFGRQAKPKYGLGAGNLRELVLLERP
jgi:hypothetical protein